MFCRSLFVLFLLAIVLSVLLRYTDSDCPFGIFTLRLFVLDQNTLLDLYSSRSPNQHSAGRHVAPLGHIILIQNQPVPLLRCLHSGEQANTNFIVFVLTHELPH